METTNIFLITLIGLGLVLYSCQLSEEETDQLEQQTQKDVPENTLTEAEREDSWKLLFDGENPRKHWRGYCDEAFPDSGWTVEDNTLKVMGSGAGEAGGQGGDIITKEKYSDFELQLEWKVQKGGNSGVFYLAEELCEEGEPIWKAAPEMQILDNENHPDARLGEDGNRQAGSLYDMVPAEPQNAKPFGEWNTARILVYQGTVVHYQNGEKVLEYHLWTDNWKDMVKDSKFNKFSGFSDVTKKGYIGLQDHGNDVWFRSIKIKELNN
jgi:hypothetical protein